MQSVGLLVVWCDAERQEGHVGDGLHLHEQFVLSFCGVGGGAFAGERCGVLGRLDVDVGCAVVWLGV